MGRKGKTQKHTAAEIANKHKLAKEKNGGAGGGKKGLADRKKNKNKISILCKICKANQPSLKSMHIHYTSKHSKLVFPELDYQNLFEQNKSDIFLMIQNE